MAIHKITDIEKLRPELLEKSPAELDRLMNEIAMAKAELAKRDEIKAKEQLAEDTNRHIEAVLAGLKFLHENGILSQRVTEAFSRGDGQFNPATFLRAVTAESLITRTQAPGDKPKRKRRTRAEIEAARAAGEPVRGRRPR